MILLVLMFIIFWTFFLKLLIFYKFYSISIIINDFNKSQKYLLLYLFNSISRLKFY